MEKFLMDYLLTVQLGRGKGQEQQRWDTQCFNDWCVAQGENIGQNFLARLEQFQRYTEQNVVDWEMEER